MKRKHKKKRKKEMLRAKEGGQWRKGKALRIKWANVLKSRKVSSGYHTISTVPAQQGHQERGQKGLADMSWTFSCPPGAPAVPTELQGSPLVPAHLVHLQGHRGASLPPFTTSAFQLFPALYFPFPFTEQPLVLVALPKRFVCQGQHSSF